MESGYDASSTVGNQSLETRESVQQEMPSLDQQIYHHQQQQQSLQQRMQNQSEMEIPAAKVNFTASTVYNYLVARIHTNNLFVCIKCHIELIITCALITRSINATFICITALCLLYKIIY